MEEKFYTGLTQFSLTKSGFFHAVELRFGLHDSIKKKHIKRSLILSAITWLPLLLLTALQGQAFGDQTALPFWKDFTNHIRFLLVLPLLIFAEGSVDLRLREYTGQFFRAGILNDNDRPAFENIKLQVTKLSGSVAAGLVILAIIVINIVIRLIAAKANTPGHWIFLTNSNSFSLSWAGIYLSVISVPVFQFIMAQWLWRWTVWCIYLKKLSKLPLKLNPAHPDLAGGIGFLGVPPAPFMVVNLALAILFSAIIAEHVMFLEVKLATYYIAMGGFALLSVLINVLPLLVFMKQLVVHRRRGIFQYSTLIQEHHRQFDEQWLGKPVKERIRGFSEASSMTDFNSTYDTVKKMRIVPFDLKMMVSSIIISVLPLVPLFAFEYNLLDLLLKVLQMLF